jgi:hypothetical protein
MMAGLSVTVVIYRRMLCPSDTAHYHRAVLALLVTRMGRSSRMNSTITTLLGSKHEVAGRHPKVIHLGSQRYITVGQEDVA